MLLASALASMRWPLCGEKMRVQKKSVISHKLAPGDFSITTLIILGKKTHNQITNITICSKKIESKRSVSAGWYSWSHGTQIIPVTTTSLVLSQQPVFHRVPSHKQIDPKQVVHLPHEPFPSHDPLFY